jgi:hypothetical protein
VSGVSVSVRVRGEPGNQQQVEQPKTPRIWAFCFFLNRPVELKTRDLMA